jgi:hypothetical protein
MKHLFLVLVCLLSFPVSSFAQSKGTFDIATFQAPALAQASETSETFDIATFQPPKDWTKKPGQDSVGFFIEDKASGAYCAIVLVRSFPGPGNPKENFDAAWKNLVKETVNVAAAPQMFPSNNLDDLALEGGFAPFEKDGEKQVAMLYTISGYGKMVNVMIIMNTQTYQKYISAFVASIKLEKPVKN